MGKAKRAHQIGLLQSEACPSNGLWLVVGGMMGIDENDEHDLLWALNGVEW